MTGVEEPLNLRHSSFVIRHVDGCTICSQPSAVRGHAEGAGLTAA